MTSKSNQVRVCLACHNVGQPVKAGSGLIEFILWCAWLLPGLIYSVWRRKNAKVCSECGGAMIPAASPKGREIISSAPDLQKDLGDEVETAEAYVAERKAVRKTIYILIVITILVFIGFAQYAKMIVQ